MVENQIKFNGQVETGPENKKEGLWGTQEILKMPG